MPTPMSKDVASFNQDDESKSLEEAFPEETDESTGEEETPESETHSDEKKTSDKKSEKDEPSEESQEETEEEELEEEEKEEPGVPFGRFQKVYEQKKALEAKIREYETRDRSLTEEEKIELDEDKKLERKLESMLARREQNQLHQDESEADELIELMELYGTFDVEKVLDIKDQYKVSNNQAAVKLYFKLHGTGSKPKGENDGKKAETKPKAKPEKKPGAETKPNDEDLADKSLSQIIEEEKKKHGFV